MIATRDAQMIAELFYLLDSNVRHDLYKDRIADERDYVSRMLTHFNYPFGIINKYIFFNHIKFQSKWYARVNSAHHERRFGCDSMIVFKVNNNIKVGLFEAKWPRVIKDPNYNWDYSQKATKKSHFTSQIERQSKWTNQAAIWEMFFYEHRVAVKNKPYDTNGSTCIRQKFAEVLVGKTPSLQTVWDNNDLINLIQSEQTPGFNGENETNLRLIIYDILTCSFGSIIKIKPTDRSFTLSSNKGDEQARCPIITVFNDNDDNAPVQQFMEENGLSFFQQLEIISTRSNS